MAMPFCVKKGNAMKILEIHMVIYIVCILWVNFLRKIFKKRIVKNGWGENCTKFGMHDLIVYFIPIVNVLDTFTPFIQAFYNYEKLEDAKNKY